MSFCARSPSKYRRHLGALSNARGAAFLLAVYVSALALLLLGGISLERTNMELRAAQVSRDVQQAFWLSESALDDAVVRFKKEYLKELTEYPAPALSANTRASFTITPAHAEIFDKNEGQVVMTSGKTRVLNLYQRVTEKITTTGTAASGITQSVNAYVVQEEPLRGIWANGTIAVGGGRDIDSTKAFVSGDLHSRLGSVVSIINGTTGFGDQLLFDGLIQVPQNIADGASQDKLDYWKGLASPELLSIKNGYKLIEGFLKEDESTDSGGSYAGVNFAVGAAATSSSHVDGTLSVGVNGTITQFPGYVSGMCQGTVLLSGGKNVVVDNGFSCDNGVSNTPGLSCVGKVHDMDVGDGIVMCANAVVPENSRGWVDTMLGSPTHLVFRKPATVVLSGSQYIDTVDRTDPAHPVGTALSSPFSMLTTLQVEKIFHIQSAWNVSLGAKISGLDFLGNPLPVEVVQDLSGGSPGAKPGMVFFQPGDQFKGSIYAPQSLVVVRARSCGATHNCTGPLNMQYVVGNEVVVELESDKLSIGQPPEGTEKAADTDSQMIGWANAAR